MKALVMTAFKTVAMGDVPAPEVGPGEVVLRVGATGICGSDVHGFLGRSPRRQPGLVLGHETQGTIHSAGAGVDAALVGQRVSINPLINCGVCEMCRAGRQNVCLNWYLIGLDKVPGAFAEYVKLHARQVIPLPAHVSDKNAVMVEPLANAVHIINLAPTPNGLFPTAAIWGGGPLGMCILAVAVTRGIRVKAVVELNPQRAKVALELGAESVINPKETDSVEKVKQLTNGRGVDLGIEAVGIEVTRQQSAAALVKGGTALYLGIDHPGTTLDFTDLVRREIRIQCSYGYTHRDYQEAFNLIESGAVNFEKWIDIEPLADGQKAFDRLVADPRDRIKIALKP